jgi:drug/metabolite transporter (DMT)-like permease
MKTDLDASPSFSNPRVSPASAAIDRSSVTVGAMCGLAVALIWAGWSVATRFAVTTNLGPQDVTFLRFGVSAVFLWPVLVRNGLGLRRIGVTRMLVMIVGAGAPFMLLTSIGMRYAPASHVATLMIGAMPIFVALLSVLLFGERFSPGQLLGLTVVVAGIACIGGYALVTNRAGGEWRGDSLFLLCGLLFASYTLAQRRSGISSWHATALVNVGSCVLFTPIYFLWLNPRIFTVPLRDVAFQGAAQGIGVAILGLYFYAEAVRRLGAPRAAIFGALAPALAVLISMPVLGEFPAWITLAGIAMVMAGVILVVTGKKARKP